MPFTVQQDQTWKTLERRWGRPGFDSLSREEQEVIALFWLEGEVMNGGLHQYFYNSSGDLALLAVSGLRRIGAVISLGALEKAMRVFGADNYPIDRDQRQEALAAFGPEYDPFEEESRILQELPESFFEASLNQLAKSYADE